MLLFLLFNALSFTKVYITCKYYVSGFSSIVRICGFAKSKWLYGSVILAEAIATCRTAQEDERSLSLSLSLSRS